MRDSVARGEALLSSLPREKLGFFPTPLYKLENLSGELGVSLYIKRDDFTGMSLFGGNKIRKLEFLMGQAKSMGAEYVITYGATQSNHAMETACAARRCGLKPILYLTAVVKPEEILSNLLLDKILGAELHIVDILPGETEDDADARAAEMGRKQAEELTASGHPALNVPMGGASVTGTVGFAAGYLEFARQADEMGISPDWIFHATGTGGTMAGLHAGRALAGDTVRIRSVTVSKKDETYITKVQNLADSALELLGSPVRVDRSALEMDTGYYAPGYEIPNAGASDAIKRLARAEGLFLDPVYTGKAFYGLLDSVEKGLVKPGETVVFWHTGGATALFAEKSILGDVF